MGEPSSTEAGFDLDPARNRLLRSISAAARELPRSQLDQLCDALESLPEDAPPRKRSEIIGLMQARRSRALAEQVITAWNDVASVTPMSLSWSLRSASNTDELRRKEQSLELVWTGPTPGETVFRRTDQALLDLIRKSRRELYLLTFAAYKVPVLNEALLAAARRGVEVNFIFESADAGKTTHSAAAALGKELGGLSNTYVWPPEERPRDGAGRYGSLHAKCAVSDRTNLLVSSANLTEYAMNMELGILVGGGNMPERIVTHLRKLIEGGTLKLLDRNLGEKP